jgi:hypothetical protein
MRVSVRESERLPRSTRSTRKHGKGSQPRRRFVPMNLRRFILQFRRTDTGLRSTTRAMNHDRSTDSYEWLPPVRVVIPAWWEEGLLSAGALAVDANIGSPFTRTNGPFSSDLFKIQTFLAGGHLKHEVVLGAPLDNHAPETVRQVDLLPLDLPVRWDVKHETEQGRECPS